jgi:hypothetical protein
LEQALLLEAELAQRLVAHLEWTKQLLIIPPLSPVLLFLESFQFWLEVSQKLLLPVVPAVHLITHQKRRCEPHLSSLVKQG